MEIITGGRRTGKTYELIKRAAKNHAVLIVLNRAMKDIFEKCIIPEMVTKGIIPEDHGITVITSATAFSRNDFYSNDVPRPAYIDEMDLVLMQTLWHKGLDLKAVALGEKDSVQWTKLAEQRSYQ